MGAHTLNVQDHRGMGRSMHAHRPTSCTSLLVGLPHRRSSALGEFALRLCEPRLSLLNSHKCADAPQLFEFFVPPVGT